MASDALLLGRITYDGFAPVWPHLGEFADKFNSTKYVVSSTLETPEWSNTTVLRGDVVEEVTKLKQRYEGDIVVHGSPQLAQTLIEHDLVDALHLQVYPVIVGAGSGSSPARARRSGSDSPRRRPSATSTSSSTRRPRDGSLACASSVSRLAEEETCDDGYEEAAKGKAKTASGFSDEERAAMKARAQELKAEARANKNRADGERDLLAAIAGMKGTDRGWPSGSMRSSPPPRRTSGRRPGTGCPHTPRTAGPLLLPGGGQVRLEVRDLRVQRRGEARQGRHVAHVLCAEGTHGGRRGEDRRSREEGGSLKGCSCRPRGRPDINRGETSVLSWVLVPSVVESVLRPKERRSWGCCAAVVSTVRSTGCARRCSRSGTTSGSRTRRRASLQGRREGCAYP